MQISTTYLYLTGELVILLIVMVCLLVYFYFRDISNWHQAVDRIKEKYQELKALYDSEKERGDIVRDNLTKAQKKILDLQAEIDAFDAIKDEHRDEIKLLSEQLEGEKERYKVAKSEIEEQALEITPLKTELEEKDEKISHLQSQIESLETDAPHQNGEEIPQDSEQSEISSSESAEASQGNEGAELIGWKQQSTLELDRLRNKNSEQRLIIHELESQLNGSDQAESDESETGSNIQKQKQMLSEAETCINILETELDTMTQKVNELEQQLAEGVKNGEAESTPQVEQLTQNLSESETCIRILENEIDTMAAKINMLEKQLGEPAKKSDGNDDVRPGMSI
ncbi:MAG: hypothetical protein L3J28_08020 [Candidatus Polarisedimenticolaceae bacterium]|nr:hypothetical protein [Candidatus Polarisedimenticolaceae bacterium]